MTTYGLVTVPRESPNDDTVTVVTWLKGDGEEVAEGEEICSLELSKAAIDLPAPRSGWLFHLAKEGDEVPVGEPVAVISATRKRPAIKKAPAEMPEDVKMTAKARKLIAEHNLDLSAFQGIAIIREKHVQQALAHLEEKGMAARPSPGHIERASPAQRRLARVVSESYQTIPHSYLTQWIGAEKADAYIERLAKQHDVMLSLSDLVVASVADLAATHRKINAAWTDEGILYHDGIHVGFALNLVSGDLVVPVIRDANKLDLTEIIGRIRGFQKKAIRKKLTREDLGRGTITVTSLIGSGVHHVMPIIVPGQSAIVAVGDVCTSDTVSRYGITLAFDHRVLNGAEAAAFLSALAARLEGGTNDDDE